MNFGLTLAAVLFWTVLGLFLLGSVLQCVHEWSITRRLKRSSILTEGLIVRGQVRPGGKTGRYCVTYSFRATMPGSTERIFTHEQQVSWRHYPKLAGGMLIPVHYLPFNPHISRLADAHTDYTVRDNSSIITIIATLLFPPFLVLWLVIFWLEYNEHMLSSLNQIMKRLGLSL